MKKTSWVVALWVAFVVAVILFCVIYVTVVSVRDSAASSKTNILALNSLIALLRRQ